MNVLYLTAMKPSKTQGGTERTTITIATQLTRLYGIRCYSAYIFETNAAIASCFVDRARIDLDNRLNCLSALISEWKIDVLINQGDFSICSRLRKYHSELSLRVVFAHHFGPGDEELMVRGKLKNRFRDVRSSTATNELVLNIAKFIASPLLYLRDRILLPIRYRNTYNASDSVVLLSSSFEDGWRMFAGLDDAAKFTIIPNALSYEVFVTEKDIALKEPVVLIVSRMEEEQKRISLALDAWKIASADPRAYGWRLDIVGDGPDLKRYKRKVKAERIPNVSFLGRAFPLENYRKASLFLLTSLHEGWGITLTEAQQLGCVPLAFDSYASIGDIVDDGVTGMLFPYGDVNALGGGGCSRSLQIEVGESVWRDKLSRHRADTSRRKLRRNGANCSCAYAAERL